MIFVLLPGSLSLTENERKNQKKYIAAKQRKKGLKKKSGEAAPLMYSVNATNPPRGGFVLLFYLF